jgi:hypothetical protein
MSLENLQKTPTLSETVQALTALKAQIEAIKSQKSPDADDIAFLTDEQLAVLSQHDSQQIINALHQKIAAGSDKSLDELAQKILGVSLADLQADARIKNQQEKEIWQELQYTPIENLWANEKLAQQYWYLYYRIEDHFSRPIAWELAQLKREKFSSFVSLSREEAIELAQLRLRPARVPLAAERYEYEISKIARKLELTYRNQGLSNEEAKKKANEDARLVFYGEYLNPEENRVAATN